MKKILITFGDHKYYGTMKNLEKTAKEIGGVDEVFQYTKEWLQTTEFWKKNSFILDRPRGAGYWIWKPFIILETMTNRMNSDDIVMYADAGMEVINNMSSLFDIANKEDKLVFRLAGKHKNKTWTKKDCFVLMKCNESKYWDTIQTTASYHLWKKTEQNIKFLKEYQKYLRDPRIVTDEPNMTGPNFLEFKDHRHDQSVLSLLTIRDNFKRYRDISQYGNEEISEFEDSNYSQIMNHHRNKY